jgi:hypothetical protein
MSTIAEKAERLGGANINAAVKNVIELEPYSDDGGEWEPISVEYDCPCCSQPTYMYFRDKYGEGVQENFEVGLVPPSLFTDEVTLCAVCVKSAKGVN